jgi:hypothetical protein
MVGFDLASIKERRHAYYTQNYTYSWMKIHCLFNGLLQEKSVQSSSTHTKLSALQSIVMKT